MSAEIRKRLLMFVLTDWAETLNRENENVSGVALLRLRDRLVEHFKLDAPAPAAQQERG